MDRFEKYWEEWKKNHSDPLTECGENFCDFWTPVGTLLGAPGIHKSLDAALKTLGEPVKEAFCSVSHWFPGHACRRLSGKQEDTDCFEGCNPHLRRSGLPEDGSTFRKRK